ncbi:hypothetical protein ACSU1N_06780 [Thermogladius sp. 4427co]|uniref:hypothetical protein n=1 Tax=Thermogladius sp. 4427co TaxID=3450718 RepID=UPI003F797039
MLRRRNTREICSESGVPVYIVKTGDPGDGVYDPRLVEASLKVIDKAINRGQQIDWRLFEDREGYVSFVNLMEEAYSVAGVEQEYSSLPEFPYQIFMIDMPTPKILEIIDELYGEKPSKKISEAFLFKAAPSSDISNSIALTSSKLLEYARRRTEENLKCVEISGDGRVKLTALLTGKIAPLSERAVGCDWYSCVEVGNGLVKCYFEYNFWSLDIESVKGLFRKVFNIARYTGGTLLDVFVEIKDECYNGELGAFYNVIGSS